MKTQSMTLQIASWTLLAAGCLPAASINGVAVSGIAFQGTPTNIAFSPFATANGTAVKISGDLAPDCSQLDGSVCLATVSGYLHNSLSNTVQVQYDFTINTAGLDSIFWGFETKDAIGPYSLENGVVSGDGPHHVTGSFFVDISSLSDGVGTPGYLSFGAASISLSGTPQAFTISIPNNSIDFLPGSSVPEPSTLALGLAGLAAIAFGRRRA